MPAHHPLAGSKIDAGAATPPLNRPGMSELPLWGKIVFAAVPIIFGITVHEVAHGWVASRLGDQTARSRGRLTLNPLRHIDPVGTVLIPMLVLLFSNFHFVFGWAKPVPVNWRNLNRPRRDMALVAAAGPVANLLMLVLWAVLFRFILVSGEQGSLSLLLAYMCQVGILINIVLMVLNLLPLPPLDGSRVVTSLLPPRLAWHYAQLERWGLLILVALMFTGILGKLLLPPVNLLLSVIEQFLSST